MTDAGEVLEFAGVFCDENDLDASSLRPGQFAKGCSSHDIPDEAGKLILGADTPKPFYIPAPAAP